MFPQDDVCQRSVGELCGRGVRGPCLSARRLLLRLCSAPASCPRLILASRGELTATGCTWTAEAAMRGRREKVFGSRRAVPWTGTPRPALPPTPRLWSARNKQPRQHKGPITRTFLEVLEALLWGFHNSFYPGVCFPSYEAIAAKAEVPSQHSGGGAEGAGVGWRAHFVREPDHLRRGGDSATCSAAGRSAGQRSGPATPTCSVGSAVAARRRSSS